jgi:lysophospholipase L1-like esterase
MSFRPRLTRPQSALAAICGALVLSEIGLRLAHFHSPPSEKPILVWNEQRDPALDAKNGLFVRDARTLWALRPGATIPTRNDGAETPLSQPSERTATSTSPGIDELERVNAAGYRGPLVAYRPSERTLRILVLGDSAAFGAGVRYEDTFSSRLESKLTGAGFDVEVIDAGVEGFTVRQGLERYRSLGRTYHAELVIAAFSGANDLASACDLADAEKIQTLAQRNHGFAGLKRSVRDHMRTWQLVTWMLHRRARNEVLAASNADRLREQELAPDCGNTDWPGLRRVSPSEFAKFLGDLSRASNADGARLILVAMPHSTKAAERLPVLHQYERALFLTAFSEDVQVLDAEGRFESRLKHDGTDDLLFLDDWNPTPFGHDLIAQWLVPLVREQTRNRGRDPLASMR